MKEVWGRGLGKEYEEEVWRRVSILLAYLAF